VVSNSSQQSNAGSSEKAVEEKFNRLVATRIFAVYARKFGGNAANKEVDIYQALEFRKGSDMPEECREGLSEKQREDIWVHGVYCAPASVIRRANGGLRKGRFMFPKDNSDDWEPCPQYKAALGKCPELVRIENCLCWTAMEVDVLHMLPRVVHPVDVQRYEICVNVRDWRLALSVWLHCNRKRFSWKPEESPTIREGRISPETARSETLSHVSRGEIRRVICLPQHVLLYTASTAPVQ
jgi:hypothetical protein